MTTLATGIFKKLAYGLETTNGTKSSAAGQYLRRVQSTLAMTRDNYQSNEIRTTQQIADFRLGMHRASGQINGELCSGSYSDFWAALLRRDFTSGVSTAHSDIVAAAGPPGTLTTTASDFLADGYKVGDIVRCTGFSAGAVANNSRNYRITALTAKVMTLGTAATGASGQLEQLIAAGSGAITIAVQGSKTYIPVSGHTKKSFTIEHWHSDVSLSEYFVGCVPSTVQVSMPPTGISTVGFGFMGQDMFGAGSQQFASPTAAGTGSVYAAVTGALRVGSTDVGYITGAQFSVNGNHSVEPVVGSNYSPDVFPGKIQVSGQISAFFADATLRDIFLNETETSLVFTLYQNSTATSQFMVFNFPRVKLGGAAKNDTDKALVQTIPFTALENNTGGTGTNSEWTTMSIQDSNP